MLKNTVMDVQIEEDTGTLLQSNTRVFRKCSFCGKETVMTMRLQQLIQTLIQSKKFYCRFCVENEFYTKKSKHVLILSYKAIISYIYYNNYYYNKETKLYLSQIQDMIDNHVKIGYQNPVFAYDPESFYWFIDFSKVGVTGRRVSVDSVIDTINEILIAFNLYENIDGFKGYKLCGKFSEAILDFYNKRYRPVGKLVLSPTLLGCILPEPVKKLNLDYREFSLTDLKPSIRK
jgi:hypothetical protein